MLSDFHTCVSCGVERLASTLDDNEQCPFCIEEGTPLPQKYPEIVVVPSKNARPRPTLPQSTQAPSRAQTPLEEAYTLPYVPPAFDQSAAEADPARELAMRELCRRRLLPFIQRFRPKYLAGWVHEDICRRLERFVRDVELGKEPRLLLMMPPRSGKSEIGSRHFPAWVLGRHPDWELIAASHTSALTLSFSRYLRDLVRDPAYSALFPDMRPDPSSQSIENWSTLSGGGYLAAGVGTGITGRGCFSCNTLLQSLTQSDRIPISTIKVGESVYGYDHRTGCVKEVEVLAISLSRTKRDLVAVEDIVCTDDHPFHNPIERSYTAACALITGMSLLRRSEVQGVENVSCVLLPESADTFDRKDLPSLQGKEGRARIRVQKLSHRASAARTNSAFEMHALLENVREENTRARRGDQEIWSAEHLLLERMLPISSEATFENQGVLRGLRSAVAACGPEEVLHPQLLSESAQKYLDERDVQPGILNAEEVVTHTKGSNLCNVRAEDISSGSASHRSRRRAQQGRELGAVVRSMSQVVSHTRGVCAGDLETFIQDEDGELVVDIQTETGNFFVGVADLLVHNCHILLLDDLVKDMEAADSPTIKENCWEWYISTAYTRLAPGGGVLGIMTWWSEDDWAGRIQQVMASSEGDVFEIVKYPAINEEGDEYLLPDDSIQQFGPLSTPPPESSRLTRPQGTALHPERYSTTAMLKKKANYIAAGLRRVWNALYQQNPTPDDGVFFTREMLRYYTHDPQRRNLYVYQAWDFAITEKQQSDWTACVTIGQDQNNNLHIMDVLRFKSGDGNAIIETVLDHWLRFKPDLLGFEDGQIWKSLTSQFKLRCEERSIYPSFNVLPPLTDKLVRAGPLRGRMQLGKVYIKQHQPWTEVFVRELMMFNSGGKHDDMCDAASWCVRLTLEKAAPRIEQPKKLKSWKDRLKNGEFSDISHMSA